MFDEALRTPDLPFDPAVLPAMDHGRRIDALRARFDEAGCDGAVLTSLVSIRYLVGFSGSAGLLVVGPDALTFVTDGRYQEQSGAEISAAGVDAAIEISGTGQKELVQSAAEAFERVGLEAEAVTWAQQRRYRDEWFAEQELVATEGLVGELRLVKDAGEIARMRAAAAIADEALARTRARLLDGPTEAEFGLELDCEMKRLGASGNSFETIVASGPNGAKPHARPGSRSVAEGDLVVIDFGAVVDGYCSDMTRTLAVGDVDATRQRMLDVVAASQQAGVDAVAAGVEAQAVDDVCRTVIDEAGWSDAFVHGTGHGVGLEIHEDPRVSSASVATLTAGHVVTVEPGVYLPEHGGVRIEDTVVVTDDGSEYLTRAPKAVAPA
jgi:Xaa-Pro aminopeptidase